MNAEQRLRAACVKALEALGDGDSIYAAAVLTAALAPVRHEPHVCDECGVGFRWPGELYEHRRHAHPRWAA